MNHYDNIIDKNRRPLVYIIMPCYNGEKYLLEQLMSIYFQNYSNWYLIFVNDWSKDKSENIVRDWISHYNLHKKVKVINKENWGVMTAVWRWLEEAKSMCDNTDDLISYCDADDIRTRDKLEIQVEYMITHPGCDESYCDISIIDWDWCLKEKSLINKRYPNRQRNIFYGWILWFCAASTTIMFRIKYIQNILPMPSDIPIKYQAQDKWTNIVLLMLECNTNFINKTLVYYRSWHTSLQKALKWWDNIIRTENHLRFFHEAQRRFPKKDITNIIKFNEDRYIKRIKKWYSHIHIYILTLLKYPNIFLLLTKSQIYNLLKFWTFNQK